MTSPLPLPALRQLLNKATAGPWRVTRFNNTQALPELWAIDEADPDERGPFGTLAADTPANIVAAVAALNAAPALLDLVERQAAAIQAVQELVDQCWPVRDQELMHPALRPSTFRARFLRALTASGITPTTEENPK